MASQAGMFNVQEFTDSGTPLTGGRLYTYAYGTTTQKTAYTDPAGAVPQTYTSDGLGGQYIALNSRGEIPSPLYLATGSYDIALKRADGSTVWTRRADGVPSTTDFSASSGSSLVGYIRGETGAVARTEQAKLRDFPTVEDFGAVGDGVTNDSAAFTAMAAAMGGAIVLGDHRYYVNGLSLSGTTIAILGVRKPSINAAFTALENGSVLVGNVNIRATSCYLGDFGVDAGSTTGLVSTTEGLVVDAPVGARGKQVFAKNLSILGSNETSTTHSLLMEGFDETSTENIDVALRTYGVVVKGRGGFVRNTRAYRMGTCAVFIKSDTSANAGNVLDGTVQRMSVKGVIHQANTTNNTAFGVYVLASTDVVNGVIVDDVQQLYGYAAVRVGGGGVSTLYAAAVQVSNIRGDNCVTGLDLFGYTFDVKAVNVKATNPTSGNAVQTSGNSSNWRIVGVDLLISDATITATNCASFAGSGSWDNFTVRNPYRTMSIPYASTVLNGARFGDVICAGEGAPTMGANWSGTPATYMPLRAYRIPGTRKVLVEGAGMPSAGFAAIMATLPVGLQPSAVQYVQSTNGTSGANSYMVLRPDGTIQPGAVTAGTPVFISTVFSTD